MQPSKFGFDSFSSPHNKTFDKLTPINSLLAIFWGLITISPFAPVKSTPFIFTLSKLPSILTPDNFEPLIDLFFTFCGLITTSPIYPVKLVFSIIASSKLPVNLTPSKHTLDKSFSGTESRLIISP